MVRVVGATRLPMLDPRSKCNLCKNKFHHVPIHTCGILNFYLYEFDEHLVVVLSSDNIHYIEYALSDPSHRCDRHIYLSGCD